jgi:hypothetical protein
MPKKKVTVKIVEPAQQALPGSESERIPELEAILTKYVSARDKRMLFGAQEVSHKGEAIAFMKDHSMDAYKRAGFDAYITAGEENIKVRIAKQ